MHVNYWKTLFFRDGNSTKNAPCEEAMDTVTDSVKNELVKQHVTVLDRTISEEETLDLITSLPLQKAAGPDGLQRVFFEENAEVWATMVTIIMKEITQTSQKPALLPC